MPQEPLPPIIARMAAKFNIPEDVLRDARQDPKANLIFSALALGFEQKQAEVDQMQVEITRLRDKIDKLEDAEDMFDRGPSKPYSVKKSVRLRPRTLGKVGILDPASSPAATASLA